MFDSPLRITKQRQIILDEQLAKPIVLGDKKEIAKRIEELHLDLKGLEIVDPQHTEKLGSYAEEFYSLRNRKGMTRTEARLQLQSNWRLYGSMMVRMGDADGMIAGVNFHYPDTIRPALQTIDLEEGMSTVAGLYMMVFKDDVMFFADTTVNIEPSAEDLAEIAIMAADTVKKFDIEPRLAMLSFSNFGSVKHPLSSKVARATNIVKQKRPDLKIDGEMQADTAVVPEILNGTYDFNSLKARPNVLIFPSLEAGNIAYKLMNRIGGAEAIGPILMGISESIHVLQRNCEVNDIVNMTAVAVLDAQKENK